MNQDVGLPKYSDQVAYIPRIIVALREMDGIAKAAAVREAIEQNMTANNEPINSSLLKTGVPKYQNDIQFARMHLVNAGMLEPVEIAGHGIWKLTDTGWSTKLDENFGLNIYAQSGNSGKVTLTDNQTSPAEDDQQQIIPGMDTWELQLKKILTTMPDKGFERLCAAIMTANGLHSTKVTGKSNDKGIDGEGLLSFDPLSLVTIRVAWQCKRYNGGTVGSQEIRDFRGALASDTKHGILFTTSTFTADAEEEARHQGKIPIKLVNLERLVELLKDRELGVKPLITHAVDPSFFAPYLNPALVSSTGALPLTFDLAIPA